MQVMFFVFSARKGNQNDNEEEISDYFVRLCHDVLYEILCYGKRRQLCKLERIGHRFHYIVDNSFREKPLSFRRIELWFFPQTKIERLRQEMTIFLHFQWYNDYWSRCNKIPSIPSHS